MVHIKHCSLKLYIFNIKGVVRSQQEHKSIFVTAYQLKIPCWNCIYSTLLIDDKPTLELILHFLSHKNWWVSYTLASSLCRPLKNCSHLGWGNFKMMWKCLEKRNEVKNVSDGPISKDKQHHMFRDNMWLLGKKNELETSLSCQASGANWLTLSGIKFGYLIGLENEWELELSMWRGRQQVKERY